jgi:hypothetical protein
MMIYFERPLDMCFIKTQAFYCTHDVRMLRYVVVIAIVMCGTENKISLGMRMRDVVWSSGG